MGLHLKESLIKAGFDVNFVDAAQLCKFDYLDSISKNIPIMQCRQSYIHSLYSEAVPGWVIINSAKNLFCVSPLKALGFRVAVYLHEGPSEFQSLCEGSYANYQLLSEVDLIIHASVISIGFVRQLRLLRQKQSRDILLEPFATLDTRIMSSTENTKLLNCDYDFGVIGTACLRKGFDRFVELAASHTQYSFCWAGSTDGLKNEGLGLFLVRAQRLRNITLLGHVNALDFYRSVKTVLHLCREDPSPLTSWEASLLRKPQIAFALDIGNPSVISANGYLLFGSYSHEILSKVIASRCYLLVPSTAGSSGYPRRVKHFDHDVKLNVVPLLKSNA